MQGFNKKSELSVLGRCAPCTDLGEGGTLPRTPSTCNSSLSSGGEHVVVVRGCGVTSVLAGCTAQSTS